MDHGGWHCLYSDMLAQLYTTDINLRRKKLKTSSGRVLSAQGRNRGTLEPAQSCRARQSALPSSIVADNPYLGKDN